MAITTKQFQLLTDINLVWVFLVDIYDRDNGSGMPSFDGNQQFVLFNGQEFLMEAAKKRGYEKVFEYESHVFDFENELNYELPEGYHYLGI